MIKVHVATVHDLIEALKTLENQNQRIRLDNNEKLNYMIIDLFEGADLILTSGDVTND